MSAVFSRRPWGRNECVTNEPQRTSAGRLIKANMWLSIDALPGDLIGELRFVTLQLISD